eukprot:comp85894_c0_seq1/m.48451 comp85894_c0_seq1/g.48451  ORF comp85894_c0_seq1/g.48451 comp85894_c0_seq1/m.48451 type:complete len:225 (-) comp85894_c0_seq1:365-1039(-)
MKFGFPQSMGSLSQGSTQDTCTHTKVAQEEVTTSSLPKVKRIVKLEKGPTQRFGASVCGRGKSVYVTWVVTGTPAFRAGLQPGDKIACVNGFMVDEASCVQKARTVLDMLTYSEKLKVKICEAPLSSIHIISLAGTTMPRLPILNGVVQLASDTPEAVAWAKAGLKHSTVVTAINGKDVIGLSDSKVSQKIARKLKKYRTVELTCIPGWLGVELITEKKRRCNM